jgi:hypothetical protein
VSGEKFDPPPPPSPGLLAALGDMKPVRTRSRWGAFVAVLAFGLLVPAFSLLRGPLRRDLGALPPVWVVVGAALWAGAVVLSLAAGLVPARGDVLPSGARASRVSLAAMGALVLFAALWTASVPGVSLHPEDAGMSLGQSLVHCGRYVVFVGAVCLLVGFLVLRRALPVGRARVGAAVGAAGGALGGLALHFICPIATTSHVLLGHVGAMLLAAVAGALLLPALLRR